MSRKIRRHASRCGDWTGKVSLSKKQLIFLEMEYFKSCFSLLFLDFYQRHRFLNRSSKTAPIPKTIYVSTLYFFSIVGNFKTLKFEGVGEFLNIIMQLSDYNFTLMSQVRICIGFQVTVSWSNNVEPMGNGRMAFTGFLGSLGVKKIPVVPVSYRRK